MGITEKELSELEMFFATTKLPSGQLDTGTLVSEIPKFVDSHLTVLRNNLDKPIYEVFYMRLQKLKEIIG